MRADGAGNGALHSRPDYAATIDCTDDAEKERRWRSKRRAALAA